MEYMKSELDLFASPPLQTNILKTEEVAINPISSLDNSSTLEFISVGGGDTYRDLSSVYLRLVFAVENDPTLPSTSAPEIKISVVNNLLHSIFKNCNVYLNNVCVSSDNLYHYRSYIENMLSYGGDSVNTHLSSCGWLLDSGNFDSIDNDGMKKRANWIKKGRQVELYGKVHADLFNQSKLLLNNVDLKVVFNMEKSSFYMMTEGNDVSEGEGKTPSIRLYSATLYMKHVTINPDILKAHHIALMRQPATYHYKRVEVKPFTIYPGNQSLSLDNVVIGQLPNLVIFGMVDSKAYNGSTNKNPYNFKHYKIQRLNLSVNSVQIPTQALEFNFDEKNGNLSSRGYQTLFSGLGIHYHDKGHQVTKELFDKGAFLTAFDLTADQCYNSHYDNLLNQGNLRIEGRFETALTDAVTCLVYCEYDSSIHIDKNRNITIQ